MKTNGYHLYQHSLTIAKTRPLGQQLTALIKHRDTCQRKLNKLLRLNHVGADDHREGARTVEVELKIQRLQHLIFQNNFDIINIQSKMAVFEKNGEFDVKKISQFNRQAVSRERHVRPDKGRIVFSKDGRYDVKEHSGAEKIQKSDSVIKRF